MIRDPSDGSVREGISPQANEINKIAGDSGRKEISPDTGIRQPVRTDAQERLERSREWLKSYFEEQRNARGAADSEAGSGLRAGSEGLEQQGDRSQARD